MATFQKFYSFTEALAEKKHDLGADVLEVALSNAANPPSVSLDAVLADFTQIAYTNLSARTITRTSSSQAAGVYSLVLQDLTLTASGLVAAFRYVIVFNQTAANDELIAFYDHGSEVTMNAPDTFLIDFGASLFTLT